MGAVQMEFHYPESADEMQTMIETRADPTGERRAAVDAAAADLALAERNLADAKAALLAHEATTPDADPAAWAARKRELFDLVPVYEGIVTQRSNVLKTARNAYGYELNRVCSEIDMGLTSASRRAYGDAHLIARKMFEEASKIERGATPACIAIGKARSAYAQALSILKLV